MTDVWILKKTRFIKSAAIKKNQIDEITVRQVMEMMSYAVEEMEFGKRRS